MAKVSSFGFTNNTSSSAAGNKLPLVKIQEITNYGITNNGPEEVSMTNSTAAVSKDEIITHFNQPLKKINTKLDVVNPGPVDAGMRYGVIAEAILTTTDDTDATYRVDEPIVVQLTVRHPKSGNITPTHVSTMVIRALSAFYGDVATNSYTHITELMKSALQPDQDFVS